MYKVLVFGLQEEQVRALNAASNWCSFARYEELPEGIVEREKLHKTFNAVFNLSRKPDSRMPADPPEDLYRFEEVVEDEPREDHDDPDYYDYTGSTASQNAHSRRSAVLRDILQTLDAMTGCRTSSAS